MTDVKQTDQNASVSSPRPAAALRPPTPTRAPQAALSYDYLSNQKEKPLREYFVVIYQYRILIFCFAMFGLIFGFWSNSQVQITYTSEAMVNIGSYRPPVDGPTA